MEEDISLNLLSKVSSGPQQYRYHQNRHTLFYRNIFYHSYINEVIDYSVNGSDCYKASKHRTSVLIECPMNRVPDLIDINSIIGSFSAFRN